MQEYSRILIEEYCRSHNFAKSRRLNRLVQLSYDISAVASDADVGFLERTINQEKDAQLKYALADLNDFLFNW